MEYRELLPLTEEEVDRIIPHRRPFRFIGGMVDVEFGKKAIAMMSDLTRPEYDFIRSHFPSDVYIPGFCTNNSSSYCRGKIKRVSHSQYHITNFN